MADINYADYSTITISLNTISDLRSFSPSKIISGLHAILSGQDIRSDKKGGIWTFDDQSTADDDGIEVVQPTGLAQGRWIKSVTSGAKGDTGDLTADASALLFQTQTVRNEAQSARDTAEQYRDETNQAKNDAIASASNAQLDADRASSAILASSFHFDARTTVPAGVEEGAYWITNTADNEAVSVYKNVANVATLQIERFYAFDATLMRQLRDEAIEASANSVQATYSYNMVDLSAVNYSKRYSYAAASIVDGDANTLAISDWIPVKSGQYYTVSGSALTVISGQPWVGFFSAAGQTTSVSNIPFTAITGGYSFLVPSGVTHVALCLNTNPSKTAISGQIQMERGTTITAWRPFKKSIDLDQLPLIPFSQLAQIPVVESEIFENYSKNLIDPSKIGYTTRYSTGSKTVIAADSNLIARTDWIPVEAGAFYTVSGSALFSPNAPQAGYFSYSGTTTAVDNVVWSAPPTGPGKMFQVPTGTGITHVMISVICNSDRNAIVGQIQLEKGESATAYSNYQLVKRFKSSLFSNGGSTSTPTVTTTNIDKAAWYKFVEADDGSHLADKLPNFRKKWLLRNGDLCVANTGTSLTARSTEHCTDHPQASIRPPLLHSNNFASIIWDRIRWEGQQYRRYDAAGYFTETGSYATSHNLSEWDDGAYRHGLTRYSSSATASVTFTVPVDAWQFNFIYRTDSLGCSATIAIAEGNNKIQVQNSSGIWVEANGFVLSMNEPTPVTRDVTVPSPTTTSTSIVNMSSKGNTTYQKRLKMRCRSTDGGMDSRTTTKAVTISRTGGGTRFMYWGVEWSPRQHMITYINAARGSHNTQTSTSGLTRYQDNEIWGFKPDLMLFELPIHNDGAAAAGSYPTGYWAGLTNNFVFRPDYELSMKGSTTRLGITMPEIAMFTASIAWNFAGINDDGTLKFGPTTDGARQMMTALDKYSEAHNWVLENQPTAVSINAAQRWVDAGKAIFGDLKTATLGSGRDGATLTNEGSHWNDTGSKIMAKAVLPILKF